jgi:chorismate mutase
MSGDPLRALAQCREHIDNIDLRILELLNQRTSIVEEIGRIKKEARLPVYEPKREDQVFYNVTSNNRGPMANDAVRRVFERIIDEMRKVQKDRMAASSQAALNREEKGS